MNHAIEMHATDKKMVCMFKRYIGNRTWKHETWNMKTSDIFSVHSLFDDSVNFVSPFECYMGTLHEPRVQNACKGLKNGSQVQKIHWKCYVKTWKVKTWKHEKGKGLPHRTNFFQKKKVFRKSFLKMSHRTNLVETKSFSINTFKRYRQNTVLIYTVFHRKWKQFLI